MSQKRIKYSLEEKVQAVESVTKQEKDRNKVLKAVGVHHQTFEDWMYRYETNGIDGLKESKSQKKYSKELKHQAIQDYVDGKYSLRECCRQYDISSTQVLRNWITLYTSGESIKSTGKGRSTMSKGRKTTYEERIEITQYCIAIDKNYQQTADQYQVSYQQVYQWVQK